MVAFRLQEVKEMVSGHSESHPRTVALIPARSGSKGVPNKNMQIIDGETLIARAIRTALSTPVFSLVVVSSDDEVILQEARNHGAKTILRPKDLATDSSPIAETVAHTLSELRNAGIAPDYLILLEPSCPLRTTQMIEEVSYCLQNHDHVFTVSLVDLKFHPAKQFTLNDARIAQRAAPGLPKVANRQELSPTYIRNGAAYGIKVSSFESQMDLLGSNPYAIVIDSPLVNIDTISDLEMARGLARQQKIDETFSGP
ncbi:MAG: acylneuraminate cytidylyltransferase family protein [Oligoflexia bacterium]|nr:acylneuraminate cytidylyltransferase family protein [Oligoflexia bacterium]